MNQKDLITKQIDDLEATRLPIAEEAGAADNALSKAKSDLDGVEVKLKALSAQVLLVKKDRDAILKVYEEKTLVHDKWYADLTILDIQLNALKSYLAGN